MKRRLLSVFITSRHIQYYSHRLFWSFGNNAEALVDRYSPRMGSRPVCKKGYYDYNRRWNFVNGGNGKQSPSSNSACERTEFTLMSYNILAQDLLDGHADLYAYHNPQALSWRQRCKRLIAEIDAVNPDILCVQELQQDHVNQFCSALARFDYALLYKKRTGSEKTDGCAVFYRRDVFDLITHHELEYFQPNVNKLNRENVAIIAKLSLKSNPQAKLVVSTTHLLYNPRRQDVRLAQIQVLLAELDRLSYSGKLADGLARYDPVILCGDFNLQPYTAPYRLLTEGHLRYAELTARTLESERYGNETLAGKDFLPATLGITDQCQHDTLKDRETTHVNGTVPPSEATKLFHSHYTNGLNVALKEGGVVGAESPTNPDEGDQSQSAHTEVFSSGSLSHRFIFTSAYRNDPGHSRSAKHYHEKSTATTFQDQWITVDYMFYTPFRSAAKGVLSESGLELLGTYTLPTIQQCSFGIGQIPNMFYGSDHFSLAARYALTVPTMDQ